MKPTVPYKVVGERFSVNWKMTETPKVYCVV